MKTLPSSPASDPAPSLPPRSPGRYEILEELGRGAMGVVYLAHDERLDRLVALKCLEPEAGPEPLTAILREARLAGTLNHPGIVTVHDLVEPADGGPPMVAMEYIQGTSLRDLMKAGRPLPPDFVRTVIGQAAEALDHAHARGVVHGDVKPANLIVTTEERVKVTDFGIARSPRQGDADARRFGTPAYVAPERLRGEPADHRADVFSLGVVAYEMLTGRPPFHGSGAAEVVRAITGEPPVPPHRHGVRLRPEVVRVLERALAKDPRHRFPSAGSLAAELRRALTRSSRREPAAAAPVAAADDEPRPAAAAGSPAAPKTSADEPPPPAGGAERGGAATQDLTPLVGAAAPPRRRMLGLRWPVFGGGAPDGAPLNRHLLAAGLVALLAVLGAAWLGLWWTRSRVPAPSEQNLADHRLRVQYVPLLKEGLSLLRRGQPAAAERVFGIAERLSPGRPEIVSLRRTAALQAEEFEQSRRQKREVDLLVESAGAHLEAGRFRQAIEAADRALALDSDAPAARPLLRQARDGLERQTAQRARPAAALVEEAVADPAQPAAAAEAPAPATEPAAPAEPRWVELKIDFFSRTSRGVLTIYNGPEQLLLRPFRFVRKTGFLRREPTSGRIEASRILPAGPTTLRVYVSLPGVEAHLETLEFELDADGPRLLQIEVSQNGETSVRLE